MNLMILRLTFHKKKRILRTIVYALRDLIYSNKKYAETILLICNIRKKIDLALSANILSLCIQMFCSDHRMCKNIILLLFISPKNRQPSKYYTN